MPRILLVDDEQSMREWLRILFQRDGFEVLTADDGMTARDIIAREYVDVVLTDIRMPRLDGVALLKAVRELAPDAIVLMMTAHWREDSDEWKHARELGAEAVEIDLRNELKPEDLSRTGVRQLRKMLDDLNLRISVGTFRTRRGYHVIDDLEARIDATKRALLAAYELGTYVVVNHVGQVPPENDSAATSTMVPARPSIAPAT